MSILWNGKPLESFRPKQGIRQGDAISPYSFVLFMERLGHLIQEAVNTKKWEPIRLSRHYLTCFFSYDIILFAEASVDQMRTIMNCLEKICVLSSQKISIQKSNIFFSKGVLDNETMEEITAVFGMPSTKNLGRYLGTPSYHGRVAQGLFQQLIDRVTSKLESWKSKQLSLAGRHTLARYVLMAIPTYTMQSTLLPIGICNKIDKTVRKLLWGGANNKKGIPLVRWEKVTCKKENGGLGLKNTRDWNLALMTKLGWRLITEKDNLWAKTLTSKYMRGEVETAKFIYKKQSSNAWRGIVAAPIFLKKGIRNKVYNDLNTFF